MTLVNKEMRENSQIENVSQDHSSTLNSSLKNARVSENGCLDSLDADLCEMLKKKEEELSSLRKETTCLNELINHSCLLSMDPKIELEVVDEWFDLLESYQSFNSNLEDQEDFFPSFCDYSRKLAHFLNSVPKSSLRCICDEEFPLNNSKIMKEFIRRRALKMGFYEKTKVTEEKPNPNESIPDARSSIPLQENGVTSQSLGENGYCAPMNHDVSKDMDASRQSSPNSSTAVRDEDTASGETSSVSSQNSSLDISELKVEFIISNWICNIILILHQRFAYETYTAWDMIIAAMKEDVWHHTFSSNIDTPITPQTDLAIFQKRNENFMKFLTRNAIDTLHRLVIQIDASSYSDRKKTFILLSKCLRSQMLHDLMYQIVRSQICEKYYFKDAIMRDGESQERLLCITATISAFPIPISSLPFPNSHPLYDFSEDE